MSRAFGVLVVNLLLTIGLTLGPASVTVPGASADYDPGFPHPKTSLGPGESGVKHVTGHAVIKFQKRWGYVYISGGQNNHVKVKYQNKTHRIVYRDYNVPGRVRGPVFKGNKCKRKSVRSGIKVVCKIPPRFGRDGKRLFVQVWPQLGSDRVNGEDMPWWASMWVLGDKGNDVMIGGRGHDYFTGYMGNDRAQGRRGNDWLRGGPGRDRLRGGKGNNHIRP